MANAREYQVSVSAGRYGYASTLAGAKKLGVTIAHLTERNDTKWNATHVLVSILKQEGVGYYRHTGWQMAVPVRGSGVRRETTVASIKKRYGVAPYKWFRR